MPEQLYTRRFGDRKEGRLVRTLSAPDRLAPYLAVRRGDACAYLRDSVEISGLEDYLRARREENLKGLGMLHLFIASYVRTVALCPALNRFVSGQKIYARYGIDVVMALRHGLNGQTEESRIKVAFNPSDTVYDVYRRLGERIDEINAGQERGGTERAAGHLLNMPGVFVKFAMWAMNLLDYFDWLPQSFLTASPSHGSMMVTDLSAPGDAAVQYPLGGFGNLPLVFSLGGRRAAWELGAGGVPVERRYIDYAVTVDTRIADSASLGSALKYLKYHLVNPALLELPPEQVAEDLF